MPDGRRLAIRYGGDEREVVDAREGVTDGVGEVPANAPGVECATVGGYLRGESLSSRSRPSGARDYRVRCPRAHV